MEDSKTVPFLGRENETDATNLSLRKVGGLFFAEFVLVTISLFIILCSITYVLLDPNYNTNPIVYSTPPHYISTLEQKHHHRFAFPLKFNQNLEDFPNSVGPASKNPHKIPVSLPNSSLPPQSLQISGDSKPPGIITALNTKALTELANDLLPDVFSSLENALITFQDGSTHYSIQVTKSTIDHFTIDAQSGITINLTGIDMDLFVRIKHQGTLLKFVASVDVNLSKLNVSTRLLLTNTKGLFGFSVQNVIVTANDINVKINHRLGRIINPLLVNIKELVLKSIHDSLFQILSKIGTDITNGVPMYCDLQQFNGAIDMSLFGDIQYKSLEISPNNLIPPTISQSSSNNYIVVGFNGETIDIITHRPLSSIPRGNITIPFDPEDKGLLTIAVDEFVFNSYYDAWYNRGAQQQRKKIGNHPDYNSRLESTNLGTIQLGMYDHLPENGLHVRTFTIPLANLSNETEFKPGSQQRNKNEKDWYHAEKEDTSPYYSSDLSNHMEILNALFQANPELHKYLRNADQNTGSEFVDNLNPPNDNSAVLLIEVSITSPPIIKMSDNKTTIITQSEQRFVLRDPKSLVPYQLLFTITTNTSTTLSMSVQYDVIVDEFILVPYLQHLSSTFHCSYSLVGPIPLDLLNIVLESITVTILLPLMNQQLFKGVNLPAPPSFMLVEPQLTVPSQGGYLLIKAGLKYRKR
jgi:hypothetical protein